MDIISITCVVITTMISLIKFIKDLVCSVKKTDDDKRANIKNNINVRQSLQSNDTQIIGNSNQTTITNNFYETNSSDPKKKNSNNNIFVIKYTVIGIIFAVVYSMPNLINIFAFQTIDLKICFVQLIINCVLCIACVIKFVFVKFEYKMRVIVLQSLLALSFVLVLFLISTNIESLKQLQIVYSYIYVIVITVTFGVISANLICNTTNMGHVFQTTIGSFILVCSMFLFFISFSYFVTVFY